MFALTPYAAAGAAAIFLAAMFAQVHSRIKAWIVLAWNLEQIGTHWTGI